MERRGFHASHFTCDLGRKRKQDAGVPSKKAETTWSKPLVDYAPNLADPVKIVCINLHVFQDAAGHGNYRVTDVPRLRQIIDWTNHHFLAVAPPSHWPSPMPKQISDSRIRFRLNRLEFYRDQALFQVDSVSSLQKAVVARDPTSLSQLNVYLSAAKPKAEGGFDGGGYAPWPPTTVPTFDSWVVYRIVYLPPTHQDVGHVDFALAVMLAHELGHALGLAHTYDDPKAGAPPICDQNHADFLADVFGTSPNTCPHHPGPWDGDLSLPWGTKTSNNILGGNRDNYWISRLQAATMHRSLTEASVRRYVATGCHDCGSCVAFTVRGSGHVSQGNDETLVYATVDLNEAWGWNGQAFVAPVRGIYHFDVSFVKDAYYYGGTQDDVRVSLLRNNAPLGRAWSGEGAGRRGTGCLSVNAALEAGDVVVTKAGSDTGVRRHIAEYNFAGHRLGDCC